MKLTGKSSDHEWHVALNEYNQIGGEFRRWMYEAKSASREVPRMALLFSRERKCELPKIHRQCSMSEPVVVEDNKLTCCIGQVCKTCPHLIAIDKAAMPDEDKDIAKAWTCATHILITEDLDTSEGFILTEDDKMFWANVYDSMSKTLPEDPQ